MNSTLFARPNLKLLLLAALCVAALKELVPATMPSVERVPLAALHWENTVPSQAELDRMVARSLDAPTSGLYLHISNGYRLRKEYHQAMHYLRKASLAADLEQDAE